MKVHGCTFNLSTNYARPVIAYAKKAFKEMRLKTKVTKMATSGKQIKVDFDMDGHLLDGGHAGS